LTALFWHLETHCLPPEQPQTPLTDLVMVP
jgi:hypothetical protein